MCRPNRRGRNQAENRWDNVEATYQGIRADRLLVRTVATLGRGLIQGAAPGWGWPRDRCGAWGKQLTLKRLSGALWGAQITAGQVSWEVGQLSKEPAVLIQSRWDG